ncbi:MAG: hypothetical protein A2Z14_09795 [Chloroflexi bacterium RBG_16_48_8]|nr:MAG: hypothetical protein A2Z14_09795 [Chloroflexi bacterium RBG_16_48_8]
MAQNWLPTWMTRFPQNVQEEAMFEFISMQDFYQYTPGLQRRTGDLSGTDEDRAGLQRPEKRSMPR